LSHLENTFGQNKNTFKRLKNSSLNQVVRSIPTCAVNRDPRHPLSLDVAGSVAAIRVMSSTLPLMNSVLISVRAWETACVPTDGHSID
jgi:hypothetical protein